jgi:hypothetical protein
MYQPQRQEILNDGKNTYDRKNVLTHEQTLAHSHDMHHSTVSKHIYYSKKKKSTPNHTRQIMHRCRVQAPPENTAYTSETALVMRFFGAPPSLALAVVELLSTLVF